MIIATNYGISLSVVTDRTQPRTERPLRRRSSRRASGAWLTWERSLNHVAGLMLGKFQD